MQLLSTGKGFMLASRDYFTITYDYIRRHINNTACPCRNSSRASRKEKKEKKKQIASHSWTEQLALGTLAR